MTCPLCGKKTKVIDTRASMDAIARKRICISCRYVFYTQEVEDEQAGARGVQSVYA